MSESLGTLRRDIRLAMHDIPEVDRAIDREPESHSVAIDVELYRLMRGIVEASGKILEDNESLQRDNDRMHEVYDGTIPAKRGVKISLDSV